MALSNNQKELIAIEVIRTLYNKFKDFPEDATNNRNAPFHEAFLNAFSEVFDEHVTSIPIFLSLASWMHGFNTSLGQSFLEKTAHILCGGEKRAFTPKANTLLQISPSQRSIVNNLITELANENRLPNLIDENNELVFAEVLEIDATSFTADVYYEDAEQVVCIELKTVKPNHGIFKGEKQKILEAKIALKNLYPNKNIKYLFGFPFDPLNGIATEYDKQRFMDYSVGFRKFISEDEFLLSAELWDFLSGEENTMQEILDIINTIATTDFMDIYNFLNNNGKRINSEEYCERLRSWYLLRDCRLIENDEIILERIANNQRLQRTYNQNIFKIKIESGKIKAEYNNTRMNRLNSLLN